MPLVDTMGQLDYLDLLKVAHSHQCALIAHGGLKEDSFKSVQEHAKNLFQDMIDILRPWEKRDESRKYDDVIEAFKQRFGDPNDPAVREKYESQAKKAMEELQQDEKIAAENKKKIDEFEQKLRENTTRRRRGNNK